MLLIGHEIAGAFILFNLFSSPNYSASSSKSVMSTKEFVESAINDNKIVIFSKSTCPYCRRAKALFKDNFPEENPAVFELDERDDGYDIQSYLAQKTGQSTVPNIFVHKQQVGGNDDAQAAFRTGGLTKLVNEGPKVLVLFHCSSYKVLIF
ncbi:thioredoxin-like protein [Mycena galopus ATCC 62051]|nr:thioredoxin-like protein [Mycena galopus ATCC 62051]